MRLGHADGGLERRRVRVQPAVAVQRDVRAVRERIVQAAHLRVV